MNDTTTNWHEAFAAWESKVGGSHGLSPKFIWHDAWFQCLESSPWRAELNKQDRLLRDSVPERWKHATSPVGCVQGYIAELEDTVNDLRAELEVKEEGEKQLSGALCEIMATAISGFADAAVIAKQEMTAAHVLVCVQKLAKATKELRAELVLKIREVDDVWENRNRFCGELNRIAKLLGFTGENVGPEVTTRYLVERLKELDELKSMLPWQYQAEKNREDAWRRRCIESDVCHEIHEMWDKENAGEACDVLRKYVRTTDRYSNADHAILMMEQTATEMKGLKAALQQSLSELAAARAHAAAEKQDKETAIVMLNERGNLLHELRAENADLRAGLEKAATDLESYYVDWDKLNKASPDYEEGYKPQYGQDAIAARQVLTSTSPTK